MNYYISDLHLFHKNVTGEDSNFDGRPFKTLEEMHNTIKENWNNTITNADHVYILGDLSWKENEDAIQFVSTLRGNKHLVLGNHDKANDQRYKQLFVEVVNYKEVKDVVDGKEYHVVMSHFPIAFWNHQHHFRRDGGEHKVWAIHLYAHLHSSKEENYFQEFIQKIKSGLPVLRLFVVQNINYCLLRNNISLVHSHNQLHVPILNILLL